MKKWNKEDWKRIYEVAFSLLALVAVIIACLDIAGEIHLEDNPSLYVLDQVILYLFITDYVLRFFLATDKKHFFKNNIPDLIAILPFNALLKAFRLAKLFRLTKLSKASKMAKLPKLFRFFAVGGRFYKKAQRFFKTNGLIYILIFNTLVILFGAIVISFAEELAFSDALWWAFVTSTTVGYGDISPATPIGRIAAGVLMLVGIGTIGMLTGTIATFFLSVQNEPVSNTPLEEKIREITDLTEEEKNEVIHYANYLKSQRRRE